MMKSNVTEYEFATIFLDWTETTKPNKECVLKLYNTIKQNKLQFWFVYRLRYALCNILKYDNLPEVIELPEYEYPSIGVKCDNYELLNCIRNNEIYKISGPCNIQGCVFKNTQTNKHVVTIKFKRVLERLQIELISSSGDIYNSHTHADVYQYSHWYLFRFTGHLCPVFTKSHTEIVMFIQDSQFNELAIVGLMNLH